MAFSGSLQIFQKKNAQKHVIFRLFDKKRTVLMRFYLLLFTRARVWVCTPTGKGWLSREVARSAWTARANKLFARRKQLERLKKTTWTLEGNKLNAWRKKHSVQLSFCSFRAQSWRDYVTQGVAPGYALIGLWLPLRSPIFNSARFPAKSETWIIFLLNRHAISTVFLLLKYADANWVWTTRNRIPVWQAIKKCSLLVSLENKS